MSEFSLSNASDSSSDFLLDAPEMDTRPPHAANSHIGDLRPHEESRITPHRPTLRMTRMTPSLLRSPTERPRLSGAHARFFPRS